MKVVLNETVKKLGYRGAIVEVAAGYFRNFLAPRSLADIATPSRLKVAESRKDKMVMEKQQVLDNAKEIFEKLNNLTISLKAKATDKGKLFGSISELDVIAALNKQAKMELDKSFLKMEHIKELGEHKISIHLGEGFDAKVTVLVESV